MTNTPSPPQSPRSALSAEVLLQAIDEYQVDNPWTYCNGNPTDRITGAQWIKNRAAEIAALNSPSGSQVECEWHGKSLGQHDYVAVPGGQRCTKCKHELPSGSALAQGEVVATQPYVDRIIRIFRDRPHDDTSALVLIDYARACATPPHDKDGGDKKDAEWTDEQCLRFLSVAFRHVRIVGDVVFDEIRQGVSAIAQSSPQAGEGGGV